MSSDSPLVFVPLGSGLRRDLESSVVVARGVVELGVGRVFDRLGIERLGDPFSSGVPAGLSDDDRVLRRVAGVKIRQAGGFDAAVEEVSFSVWHRMLFARFLAENRLLMHPEHNVPVSLQDCADLAVEGAGSDRWVVASSFAAHMLPGLFPTDDPLGQIVLLPEDLVALEEVLDSIPVDVFTSDDGLGWVYQFWQSQRKDEVNKSEVKIGARELPAVTQLFTEHYMVRFLLENSLGAWWAARHPDSPLLESFEYLRFDDDGNPAAGSFEGWSDSMAEVTAMDPCCGSGHFLTSLFEMLWRMRVEEEGMDPVEAQDRVLAENLFGLELDPRCTQIAAFNVALAAWKAGGYRELPELNIACSGIRVAGSRDSWLDLAGDDPRLRDGLERLHDVFKDADTLGSLIDPKRTVASDGLMAVEWDEIRPLLDTALTRETADDPAAAVFGAQVTAVAKAADLLAHTYTLVATNPPFLGQTKHSETLKKFLIRFHPLTWHELALAFLQTPLVTRGGSIALVTPGVWRQLARYEDFRRSFLSTERLCLIADLGHGAFQAGIGPDVVLSITSRSGPDHGDSYASLDVAQLDLPSKRIELSDSDLRFLNLTRQLENPAARIAHQDIPTAPGLSASGHGAHGLSAGDANRFRRVFWEVTARPPVWQMLQTAPAGAAPYTGRSTVVLWENESGEMAALAHSVRHLNHKAQQWRSGKPLWGKHGVVFSLMGDPRFSVYSGDRFASNCAVVVPSESADLTALWAFCMSGSFTQVLKTMVTKRSIEIGTILDVPFDVEYWRGVAEQEFPDGLPEPWSDDPTQWLFLGDPFESTDSLQVGVARLLGYQWPDQEADDLDVMADEDGIVCLPAVAGERAAADRLRDLMVAAYDGDGDALGWIDSLLGEAEASGKGLGWWLGNRFFKQHHQLFHKRPFIWHITDHHAGGFSALVNYHTLDRSGLERLTFEYLGWWIDVQQAAVTAGEAGADGRLAAAVTLQDKLKLILAGEPPFDVFVRWKEMADQSLGWDPDPDDGVRLNIRPFVEAGVLKVKKPVGIKWGRDRGKNPDGSERLNDLHYTIAEKQAARDTR